ncbi:unnamed protein product [Lupinus luteus]|uniref:Uncharacterized protein n=2 Tax=Lupinus luteus TaxID=3873 RepID=A0AAV1WT88_LUPLU
MSYLVEELLFLCLRLNRKKTISCHQQLRFLLWKIDSGFHPRPDLWSPTNRADSPSLRNPLLLQERMGCGWLGAIFEWEGVLIEDNPDLEKRLDGIMALVSTRPKKALEYATVEIAQLLNFIPERCVVFGNSNKTIEAAHDARMKCVAVASKHPVYELGAADLVLRHLDELTVVDLKKLVDVELDEFKSGEPVVMMEVEENSDISSVDDSFW